PVAAVPSAPRPLPPSPTRRSSDLVVVTLRGPHTTLLEWADAAGLYVRIDRRSEWGNPFEPPADGDRDTVITNYAEHYLPYKPSLDRKSTRLNSSHVKNSYAVFGLK